MNIGNFINVYTNIYTYIICDENDSRLQDFHIWSCVPDSVNEK